MNSTTATRVLRHRLRICTSNIKNYFRIIRILRNGSPAFLVDFLAVRNIQSLELGPSSFAIRCRRQGRLAILKMQQTLQIGLRRRVLLVGISTTWLLSEW